MGLTYIHKTKTTAALSRYVAETIRAHRALSLGLPDLTLALISPFATMHRILLRMPEVRAWMGECMDGCMSMDVPTPRFTDDTHTHRPPSRPALPRRASPPPLLTVATWAPAGRHNPTTASSPCASCPRPPGCSRWRGWRRLTRRSCPRG